MTFLTQPTQAELAAHVQGHLRNHGITVVLSGGAAVSIYTANKYVSRDIDLVNVYSVERRKIRTAMEEIGFRETRRYFHHPASRHIVEFPPGPLAIDDQPVRTISRVRFATGTLRVISATDCVKDRLAAFYFWDDQPSLEQAVLVAGHKRVRMAEVRAWSRRLGMLPKFEAFLQRITYGRQRS